VKMQEITDLKFPTLTGMSGRVLDILEQRRIIDRTVVVFTTDHGDMQGSHRLRYKGVLSYEELYRIPLIIYDPNRTPARKVISDLVSNVSLPATLAELAGLSVPETSMEHRWWTNSPPRKLAGNK